MDFVFGDWHHCHLLEKKQGRVRQSLEIVADERCRKLGDVLPPGAAWLARGVGRGPNFRAPPPPRTWPRSDRALPPSLTSFSYRPKTHYSRSVSGEATSVRTVVICRRILSRRFCQLRTAFRYLEPFLEKKNDGDRSPPTGSWVGAATSPVVAIRPKINGGRGLAGPSRNQASFPGGKGSETGGTDAHDICD